MNPWLDPAIPAQMRAKADEDFARPEMPVHFRALADAVRATQCPGEILEVGCGVGHGREILDRSGVEYRSYTGVDINPTAIALAKERYPESWWESDWDLDRECGPRSYDVVVDGSCLLHVDDWRAHIAQLCRLSRRWVILHRIPLGNENVSSRAHTTGYGHHFPAWTFGRVEVVSEMAKHGFEPCGELPADGGAVTMTFARPRHYVTYADDAYLPRLKALYASMVRHCQPFKLHVLAWGPGVAKWCLSKDEVHVTTSPNPFLDVHPDLSPGRLPGPPRSKVEHYWTCGPQWIADVMHDTGESVSYVDSDILFFSSPEPVFAETGGAPAGVVPHGFARKAQGLLGPTAESHEVFGKYNVGLVHFNDVGVAREWARLCRDWCYDRLAVNDVIPVVRTGLANLYGDQKWFDYLKLQHHLHEVQHPGACLGPWAVHTRALDVRNGQVYFGGRKLVSYHYSALKLLPHGGLQCTRPEYGLTRRQEDILYALYLREIDGASR